MPDSTATLEVLLRWFHFLAGITWIGLLYFFNLVNVPLMKALDGPTKGKVIPQLMPRALWWFRHAAWVTVLVGFIYWYLIIKAEPDHGGVIGKWLVVTLICWGLVALIVTKTKGAMNKGPAVAVCVSFVALALAYLVVHLNGGEGHTSRAISIGIGGGYGLIMMLNVWGIIWRCQKKIIAWTSDNATKGTPIPPESAVLARQAFLASRTNAWLSIPMLFFMAAASHYPLFGG